MTDDEKIAERKRRNCESAKRSAAKDPVGTRLRERAWKAKNPEKARAARRRWVEKNQDRAREIGRAASRRCRAEEPGKRCAWEAARNARKRNATPMWADLKAIRDFYEKCPEGWHVDHIIPLKGEIVCGLHVLENLQYLPAAENARKKNRFDPEALAA